MSGQAKERALDRIAELARGLQRPRDVLARGHRGRSGAAVPYYWTPCWYTLDPASLLVTSHFHEGMPEIPARVARGRSTTTTTSTSSSTSPARERGISTLHEATNGDPSSSPRWHANMELGGDQEMIARLRTRARRRLGRARPVPRARQPDVRRRGARAGCEAAAPHLAEGARRALLARRGTRPRGTGLARARRAHPGLGGRVRDAGRRALGRRSSPTATGTRARCRRPSSPSPAARCGPPRDATRPGEVAVARVLSRSGTWVVAPRRLRSSAAAPARVAVIVEPAHPARITPLLMSAYGLTEREQEVTRLVLQGDSTAEIAERLVHLTAHGAGAPQAHLREDRRAQPARAHRQGVLRPLRAARARQRAARRRRATAARRAVSSGRRRVTRRTPPGTRWRSARGC